MRPKLFAAVGIAAIGIGSILVFGTDFRATTLPQFSEATAAELNSTTVPEGFQTVTLTVANMTCASSWSDNPSPAK